jgi:hypothetical protein
MTAVVPLLVVLAVVASALWVYVDESTQSRRGTPVVFSFRQFIRLDTPGVWFGACLFLWPIFFPLYISGRRR